MISLSFNVLVWQLFEWNVIMMKDSHWNETGFILKSELNFVRNKTKM